VDCLKLETILAYVKGTLSEEKCFELESHLAECDECAKRVRAHRFLLQSVHQGQFDHIWDSWTASRHAEEYLQDQVTKVLRTATYPQALQQRVRAWQENLSQKAWGGIIVLIDASRHTVRVIKEGLEALHQPGMEPAFRPVSLAEPTSGGGRHRLLHATVTIHPEEQTVTVKIPQCPEPWPILLLFVPGTDRAYINPLQPSQDETCLLAVFRDIKDGEWILLSEPDLLVRK